MASLYGISLKNVVNFKGHEGEPLMQGNVYFNGEKIGFYSDGDWGSECRLDISKEYQEEVKVIMHRYAKDKKKDNILFIEDLFFGELGNLINFEKKYKKYAKQGYPLLAIYDNEGKSWERALCASKWKEEAFKMLLEKEGYTNIKIYTSLEDFMIG